MTRALAALALAASLALPAAAQRAPSAEPAPTQLARSVSFELRRLGYDVAPEELTQRQTVQLHLLLEDVPLFGLRSLKLRQRVETILASPDGAGTWF